jgi:hypothetical protein
MTPPHSSSSSNKSFAVYVIMYTIVLASLALDIQRGGILFTLVGTASSILLTTLIAYRMAQAMAFSPTGSRLAPLPVPERSMVA